MEEGALAVPPGNLTFELTADSGDYMEMTIDFGDGHVETFSIRFHNNMPIVIHDFTMPGHLNVTYDLSCPYNQATVFMDIYVVYPINNITVTPTLAVVGGTNYLELWLDDGTDVNVTVVWGDGDIFEEVQGNFTNLPTTLAHQYVSTSPGPFTMSVVVYITNALSEHVQTVTLGTDYPIVDFQVTVSAAIITSGTTVTFTLDMSEGSQLHCLLDYGDGSAATSIYEEYIFMIVPIRIDKVYTALGDHHYNYTCWNHVSNVTHLGTIFLNEAITGVVPSVMAGGGYALGNDFTVTWTFSTGEPAYFNASIGDVKGNDTIVTYSPKQGSATFYAGTLVPGEYLFILTGENARSTVSDTFMINVDRPLAGLTWAVALIDPDYVTVGRATLVRVGQTDGSRVTDYVLLDGEVYFNAYSPDLAGGPDSRNLSVYFSTPGTYVVSLVSGNSVGNTTAANTVTVKAEVPLDNVTLEVSCACVGSRVVTLGYVLSADGGPSPSPNATTVDIDYGDGNSDTNLPVDIPGAGSVRLAAFNHTYATTGVYYATLTASNHVSTLSSQIVLVDVAEVVTDLNVSIPSATAFGTVTNIDVTAASGTDVKVTVSFGDGTSDVLASYATASLIEPITHEYTDTGDYNVTVTVVNSKLNYVKSRLLQVDKVITEYGRIASNAIFGTANWVNVSTTLGSRMELFVDPDVAGDDGYVYDMCLDASPSAIQFDFIYPVAGVYLASVYLTNSVGHVHDQFALAANIPVENFNMAVPTAVNFTDGVTFNRSLTGSHVSCYVQYGDGNVQLTYEETPGAPMVFDYNYTEIGEYEFKASCYNYISEESVAWTVYVQEPLEGYIPHQDITFATGQPLVKLSVDLTLDITSGTNVSVSVTYVPSRTDVNAFVTWDGLSGNLELPYPVYGYGLHDVNITIENAVSRIENIFQVTADDMLSNVSLTADELVPAFTELLIILAADAGSNVCVGIDFDDGTEQQHYTVGNVTETCTVDASFLRARCGELGITQAGCEAIPCCYDAAEPSVKCFLPDVITGFWRLDVRYTFSTDGVHEIGVSAGNAVGSMFRMARVYVQYPVKDLSIVDITMARDYTFGIHLSADPPATDAYVHIYISDGSSNMTMPLTATLGSDQMVDIALAYDAIFMAVITIYNNVSSLILPHLLSPQVAFENSSLVLLGPQLPGSAHNLTLTFDAGLGGSLYCDWGDEAPEEVYSIKGIDFIPHMNHTYGAIGSYKVKCTLNNMLSSKEFCHTADVDTDITGVTLSFSHTSVNPNLKSQPLYTPTPYTISAATGSRLSVLLFDSDGNVAYQLTNDVTQLMTVSFTYLGPPEALTDGKLEICNARSCVEVWFVHALQWDLRKVTVEIDKEVVELGVEPVTFTVLGGGNTTANISYDLGNGVIYETNLTSGADFSYMYPVPNSYPYNVTVRNYVDSIELTGIVHVQVRIQLECDTDFSFEFGGPLNVNFKWSGTNGQVRAIFNGVQATPEVDYLSKSGNVTIPESDYQLGETYIVIFNVSNHISTAECTINVDVDEMIEDLKLSTSVMYTAVNDTFTVNAVIPSGTRLTWYLDYNNSANATVDDTAVVVSGEHTMSIQYVYTTDGYRNIAVSVSNSLTILFRSIFLGAEFPIIPDNLAVEVPSKVDRPGVTFSWSIYRVVHENPPTGVIMDLNWSDAQDENISVDLTTTDRIDKDHQYSTYFLPTVITAFLRNNITNATLTSPIQCGIDIENLTLTADGYYKQPDEVVEAQLHVDSGTRVMYTVHWGDGSGNDSFSTTFRDDPGDWRLPDNQTTNHTYKESGLFTVTLTANNSFGIVTVTQSVKVEYCILGTEIQPTPPIAHPPGVVQYTISVADDQYMSPTDVSCDFNYGNGEAGRVSAVFNSRKEFLHTHTYSQTTAPDYYNTTVNCSNYVCSSFYHTEVLLIQPIANITISIINEVIKFPDLANFTVQITSGSHLTVEVSQGDGSNARNFTATISPTTLELYYFYRIADNYTVSISASNALETQTTVSVIPFIVRYPIPPSGLIVTSDSPFDYTENAQFFIDIEASATGPTDLFCTWRFSIGGVEVTTYAGPLQNHDTHVAETRYTHSQIGEQTVSVNCSNGVSWRAYTLVIEVAEAIEGFRVDVSHTHSIVGETVVTFTFTVTHGSNVTAEISFGDGATDTAAFPDLIANRGSVDYNHTFNTSSFNKPNFRVMNSLNLAALVLPQPPGSVEVVSEYAVIDIDFSALNVTRHAIDVTFKVKQIQRNAPSNTLIKWIHGNGEEDEESLTFSNGEREHQYKYLTDGWYSPTVLMWNNVSTLELSLNWSLQVGVWIEGPALKVNNTNVATINASAVFTAHVDQGSEVEYIITIGNGDVTPVQMRHDPGYHNVSDDGWTLPDDTVILYTFPLPGDFWVNLTTRNVFGEITIDLNYIINAENAIQTHNISSLVAIAMPPGDATIIIENLENVAAPTDALCTYTYGDGQSDTVNMVLAAAENRFVQAHKYQAVLPGVYTINVNCSNKVSSQEYVSTLMVQQPVSKPTVGIVQHCVRTNTVSEIWVLITEGSHVLYNISHGDGTVTERFIEYPLKNETVNFRKFYSQVGNYTVTIYVSNNISAESTVIANTIDVQNPITSLNAHGGLTLAYPRAVFNLTVETNRIAPPTDVFCRYSFYIGQPLMETFMADSLGIGEKRILRHTYIRERLGTHLIFVNCSNCVNYMFQSFKIWVDETITGFEVANSTMFVKTGDPVTWTYSVKKGTNVEAYLTVGDESTRLPFAQFTASLVPLKFTLTFDTAANHSQTFMVKNNISQVIISPTDKLVVQFVAPEVYVTVDVITPATSFVVASNRNIKLIVTPKPSPTPGTDLFVCWKSDYEEWETYSPDLGRGIAHTEDHAFLMIGDILLNVVVKNKVSQYTTSVLIHSEEVIKEPYIVLHNPSTQVNEPTSFSIGVQNGSHLHFEVDFKDGSPPETFIHQDKLGGRSLTISHVFTLIGNYSVYVKTYNNMSEETITANKEVIVQGDIALTLSGPRFISVDLDQQPTEAIFTITTPSHHPVPQNVHLALLLAWSANNANRYIYADTFRADNTYDFSSSFDGSVLGLVTVTVNASNLISWNTANMTIYVLLKIKNLDANVTLNTVQVDSVTTFAVWVKGGSDVTYTISYGDGLQDSCFKRNHSSSCVFDHKYGSDGIYSVNVTATNDVSQEQVKLSVKVQFGIDTKSLLVLSERYISNPNGRVPLELRLTDGAPIPTDVDVTVSCGDGSVQSVSVTAFPLTLTCTYSSDLADFQLGKKLIMLNLTNLVSNGSIVVVIYLEEPIKIKGIELVEYAQVGEPTTITVIFETGSDYEALIKVGDGEHDLKVHGKVGSVQVNHTCSIAASYDIKVFARNNVSADSSATTLPVLHPVRGLQLMASTTVKLGFAGNPDQTANFTLIKTPGEPIPSNTTITTNFDDGSQDFSEDKLISPRYTFHYSYREVENYTVTVTVSNGLNSMTFNATVQVLMEITGCDFTYEQAAGQQSETSKIPVQTNAILRALTASGSNTCFKWIPEPGVSISSCEEELMYMFQQIGFPNVQLECYNLVSKDTVGHIIEIFSPIGIHVVEFEQVVEVNTNVTFKIYLTEAIDAVCFSYHFKSLESSLTFWRGDLDVCKADSKFNEEMYLPVEEVSDDGLEYTIVSHFPAIAEYNVTFKAFNVFASVSKTLPFSVRAIPCNAPIMNAKEGATINMTLRYKRAQEFTISSSQFMVVKRCKATDIYVTALQVYLYQLTETGGEWVQQDIINPLGEGDNVRSFFFERQMLGYGQYYLLYSLQPKGFPDNSNSSKIYFRIEGTLMTTSINKVIRDVVGTMRVYRLTVFSEDPDNDQRPFGYEFYCSEEAGIWSNETVEDTIRRLDMTDLVDVPTGDPTEVAPSDQLGCWGQPAGRLALDARESSFEFNTGWMVHSKEYVFIVLVSKGERRVVATINVKVSQGNPPQISIQCYEAGGNCKQNAKKIDRKKPLALTFLCDSCLDNLTPTFETSFSRQGKPFKIPSDKDEKAKTFTLEDGKTILWTQDISFVKNPGLYELEVIIKLLGFPDGFTAFSFAINQKPHSGTIKVGPPPGSPETDEEFIPRPWTALVVEAVGFQDDGDTVITIIEPDVIRERRQVADEESYGENHPDLKFAYSYVKKGKEIPFFGDTVLLPEGHSSEDYMIELIVVVTDNYGGKTTYSKSVKVEEQVYDDPEEAAAADAEKEELLDSIISADLSQTTDVVGALSNIISAISDSPDQAGPVSGAAVPGSNQAKEEAEAERLAEIKQQDRLAIVMTGLVNLATSDASDPETIKATFEAYAVIVKQQSGAASSSMKSDSLDIAASFLTNIDQQEDKEGFLNSFVDTMGDALSGALAISPPPPAQEENDVPSEDEDDSDDAAAAAAKAAEEAELAKKAAANLETSTKSIVNAIKSDVILDGEPLTVGDKKLSVTIAVTSLSRVNGSILTTGGSEIMFPMLRPVGVEDEEQFAIFFQVTYSEVNVFSWVESAKEVDAGTTSLDVFNQDFKPLDFDPLTEPLNIDMKQLAAVDNWANMDNMTVDKQSNLIYMYVPIDVDKSAFVMELDLNTFDDSTDIYFEVYFKFGATDAIMDRPNMTKGTYDLMREVPNRKNPLAWVIIIAEAQVQLPGIYIGIIPKVRNSTKLFNQTTVPAFNMRSSLPRCRAWDMTEEIWSGKFCKVGLESSIDNTRCQCGELSRQVRTYSGGISVPKVNTIDFSKVFANFADLLAANPTVLATILSIFILYLLLLLWARRADQKDMEKWCVTPLVDNPLNCPHLYKVSVYTGLRQGAGTHSKVCFIVSGDKGDTGIRVLDDGRGKNFERATLRHFLMTSEQPLGDLTFMRVWHDNSGQGPAASWYLDKIIVEDILGRTRYFFLNGRWLAVDEDDGQVDRLLPTAAHEEIDGFNHIFFSQARHNLTDDHLWISVISRPTKSSFTRSQRLTCCLALLCTTMVANAMFYGSAGAVEKDQSIRIGPIILSVAVLLVSIFSSLTIIPVNLLLVQLFRKSRPRGSTVLPDGSELRTTETGQKDIAYMRRYSKEEKNAVAEEGEDEKKDGEEKKKSKKKEARKYWFPWWGIIIAWVVALLASVTSLFFVLLYSLQWGKVKSEEWLSSLILSFFQSVIVIQPVKVIIVAMMMSLVFKKFTDEEEEIPLNPTTGPGSEDYDEVLHIDRQMFSNVPTMPNKRKLEKARRQRELDKKLAGLLVEIMSYFFFLLLIAFIAFGSFDIQRYRHTSHLRKLLQGTMKQEETLQWVSDQTKMWKYLDVTVADVIYNVRDYNKGLTTRSDRRYLKDNTNVRVGAVRLRQVRVKPALCQPPDITRNLVLECNSPYHITREQKANFSTFWLNLPVNHTDAVTELQEAFRYKGILELKTSFTIGRQALYNGGGYVANLGTSPNKARRVIKDLMDAFWVDYYTRAVFLEFTVYNANSNLFGFVQYVFEIPPSGGVIPMTFVYSFSVYTVFSAMGTVVVVCQILYILILLYFIVREIRKLRKETAEVYFSNPWNIYEVVVIVTSVIGISMYAAGEAVGRLVTKELGDDKDGYTYYERFASYTDVMTLVIGLIVFLTNIRFMRLLRLNRHVVDLYHTLRNARKELMYFSVTFFIVFSSYSLPAVIFFGTWMYGHSDIFKSISGTFNILLGRLYWHDMMIANPIITPIYFFFLVVTLYFILVNMFVSILTTSYQLVRLNPDRAKESEYKVMAFISAKLTAVFCCCFPTKKTKALGKDYLDNLDSLDDRVNHINNMINRYYRKNIKSKYRESKPKTMETKGDMNDPSLKKKMWADMMHF